MPKKFYFLTFGCQMNVYDTERAAQLLVSQGYVQVNEPRRADIIWVNTCSVRDKAEQKVYSALGRFQALKNKNARLILGVGGCLAQQEGEALLRRVPYLDFVLGTKELRKMPEILEGLDGPRRRMPPAGLRGRVDPYSRLPFFPPSGKVSAFVSIMQGCDNFCSYCIVPFVRGREMSRPAGEILEEIRSLAEGGVKEVTLLGQNVNSYGSPEPGGHGFVDLLEAVQEIPGIRRIRFTTSHPKDLSPRLIGAFGRIPKLCDHIHLPLQSGSNRILDRMNRGYSVQEYAEKVTELRRGRPDMSVTTDLIVGFPGEEEADHQATLEAVGKLRFNEFFSFRYSDRPRTRASQFPEKVPEGVKQRRLAELHALQKEITHEKNKALEGRELEVLVEGRSKAGAGEKTGRSRANRIVNFPGDWLHPGDLVEVKILEALAHSLRGKIKD